MTKDKQETKDIETDEYWKKVMEDNEFQDYLDSKEEIKKKHIP